MLDISFWTGNFGTLMRRFAIAALAVTMTAFGLTCFVKIPYMPLAIFILVLPLGALALRWSIMRESSAYNVARVFGARMRSDPPPPLIVALTSGSVCLPLSWRRLELSGFVVHFADLVVHLDWRWMGDRTRQQYVGRKSRAYAAASMPHALKSATSTHHPRAQGLLGRSTAACLIRITSWRRRTAATLYAW